jgi:phosphoenolpyruvate synthase/pyruvate phosphate dikinase
MPLESAFNRKGIPIYPWYISDLVATKEFAKISGGLTIKKVVFFLADGVSNIYYDRHSTDAIGARLLERINRDKKFYRLVASQIYYYGDQLIDFCTDLKKIQPEHLSDSQLLKIAAAYEKKLGALRAWGWVPPILDGVFRPFLSDLVMAELKDFLRRKGMSDKVAEFYSLLSSSEKKSEVQVETLARLRLLVKIKDGRKGEAALSAIRRQEAVRFADKFPKAAKQMKRHLDRFGWLTYAYAGPAMSFDYLIGALAADMRSGDLASQIKAINDHFRIVKKEKAVLSARLKLPVRLAYLFRVSSELMFIKDYRKGIYQKSYLAMDKIIAEIARRLGLSLTETKQLVLAEMKDALLNKQYGRYRSLAKKRVAKCAYIVSAGRIKVLEGRSVDKLISKIKKESGAKKQLPPGAQELKGSIAYAGLVRGRVRIVLTKDDVPKFKSGEILVSSATNPDLISAMKRAAAFITDTGGIICHAAIVARELKKPCVIGTKIATSVLRDGDLVEVDANQGIVRILNK